MLIQGWSGEIALAQSENPAIRYVIPSEGTLLFVDNLAIPARSSQATLAHAFIDFLLRPEIAARIANYTRYASANSAARPWIDRAVLDGPSSRERTFQLRDVGPAGAIYSRFWTDLKAGD